MKVSCNSCQATLNIDEKKIPAGGARIRCPTCGSVFPVKPPSSAVPLPGAPAIPGATRSAAPPSNVKLPGGAGPGAVPLPGGASLPKAEWENEQTRAVPSSLAANPPSETASWEDERTRSMPAGGLAGLGINPIAVPAAGGGASWEDEQTRTMPTANSGGGLPSIAPAATKGTWETESTRAMPPADALRAAVGVPLPGAPSIAQQRAAAPVLSTGGGIPLPGMAAPAAPPPMPVRAPAAASPAGAGIPLPGAARANQSSSPSGISRPGQASSPSGISHPSSSPSGAVPLPGGSSPLAAVMSRPSSAGFAGGDAVPLPGAGAPDLFSENTATESVDVGAFKDKLAGGGGFSFDPPPEAAAPAGGGFDFAPAPPMASSDSISFEEAPPSETLTEESAFGFDPPPAPAPAAAPAAAAPLPTMDDMGFDAPPAPPPGGFDFPPPPAAAPASTGFDFAAPPAEAPAPAADAFDFAAAEPATNPAAEAAPAGGFDFAPPPQAASAQTTVDDFAFSPPPPVAEPAGDGFDFAPPPPAAPAGGGFDFAPPPPAEPTAGGFDFAPPPPAAPAGGGFDFAPPPPAAPAGGGFDFAPPPAAAPTDDAFGFIPPPEPTLPAGDAFGFAPPPAAPPAAPVSSSPSMAFGDVDISDSGAEFDPSAPAAPTANALEADLSAPAAAPAAPAGPADGLEMLSFIDEGANADKPPGAPTMSAPALSDGPARRFHIRRRSGKVFGPFEDNVILKMLESGQLLGNEEISSNAETWQPIGQEALFQSAISKLIESPSNITDAQAQATIDDKPKGPSMDKLKELYEGRMAGIAVAQHKDPINIKKYIPLIAGGVLIAIVLLAGIMVGVTTPYGFFGLKLMFPAKVKADTREFAYLEEARKGILKDTFKSYKDAKASAEQALATREYPEARAVWSQAVYYLSRRYRDTSSVGAANEQLENIQLIGKKHVEVLKTLAGDALNTRKPDAALAFVGEALAREDNQNDLELMFLRAEAYQQKNQTAQAKSEYEQILKKNPKSAKALHALGLLHRALKELGPAVEKLKAALEADPEHGASAVEMASILAEKGEFTGDAIKVVDDVLTEANRKALAPSEAAQALALRASVLISEEKTAEGVAMFEEALKIDATNAFVQSQLGKAYLDLHQPDKALPYLKTAADARSDSIADTERYLTALLQLSKLDDASKVVAAANARFPGNAELTYLSAQVADALDHTNEAIEGYRKAIAAAPENGSAYLHLARLLMRMRRYADARPEIEKGLEKAPENAGLRVGLAELLLRERNLDGAEKEFKAALEANPKIAEAYLGQSVLAYERGNFEQAEKEVQKALELNPRISGGHLQNGKALWHLGKLPEAIAELEVAKELEPFNMEIIVTLGAVLFDKKDLAGAETQLMSALVKEPGNPDANYYLARLKNERSENNAALEAIKRAIEFDGKNPLYHFWIGRILVDVRRPAEAMEEWNLALNLKPGYADVLQALGKMHYDRGDTKLAIDFFEKTLASDPSRNAVRLLIGDAYTKLNQWDSAIKNYSDALTADPALPDAEYKIGLAWEEKHVYAKAIDWFKKATEKNDADGDAWKGLGLMYAEVKKKKEAIEAYKKYLEVKPNADDKKDIEDQIYFWSQKE